MGDTSSYSNPSCSIGCEIAQQTTTVADCAAVCTAVKKNASCLYTWKNHSFQLCETCPKGCNAADAGECQAGCAYYFEPPYVPPKVFPLTLRQQHLERVGRQRWVVNETEVQWKASETVFIIVDMWNQHWCPTATMHVSQIAVAMNHTLNVARESGAAIVWAPSDVTSWYTGTSARNHTLSLPKAPVPAPTPVPYPQMPISSATDGGCNIPSNDVNRPVWTHQVDTLVIHDEDFVLSADEPESEQELANILAATGAKNVVYSGVHENMCIMNRPFTIDKIRTWAWPKERVAIIRDLTYPLYTPVDPPYVTLSLATALQTAYIEKFWGASFHSTQLLAPWYEGHSGGVLPCA